MENDLRPLTVRERIETVECRRYGRTDSLTLTPTQSTVEVPLRP
jgi:hypothetical protein